MNFPVKSGFYKVFFTYYENLLTKHMKKIIFLLYQFCRARKIVSFKKNEKTQNLTF
jgi:hypothetical protein